MELGNEGRIRCRVNINGTSADDLAGAWLDVIRTARALNEALAKATPHGRDYQTVGDTDGDAYRRDRAMHQTMQTIVRNIREYAQNSVEFISDQQERQDEIDALHKKIERVNVAMAKVRNHD